ncbi:MAG TPA: ribosome maturation factor RimP [Candidatus Limnocylindrales bacterium]|nr:ribosome maturation factor RimP [Candidatus Limnocylindrales bacterium]
MDAANDSIGRVWQLVAPLAANEGLEIVDIELKPEGGRSGRVLRVYLEKQGGPSLDELSRVSRGLSDLLDEHDDVVDGAYTLEISSPGINRPLKRPEHFSRFVGKKIRVRTREMINGRRSFLGELLEVSAEKIVVKQDGTRWEIAFSQIDKSNYEHDWSA